MVKKFKAVEIIPNKLWITYDDSGAKSGTMSPDSEDDGWLIQYLLDGSKIAHDRDNVEELFSFEEKSELSSWHQQHVFGYPVIKVETFKTQEKENLPCFTKTPTSKTFFAAGYYGINFENGGWMDAFCPKLSTLRKYEYIGPFKTETDVQIAVKRKLRDYD